MRKKIIPQFWHYINEASMGSGLIIIEFGYHSPPPKHAHAETRDNYLLEFITAGICYLEIAEGTYTLRKGDAFLIPPKMYHKYTENAVTPSKRVWLSFSGADANSIASIMRGNTKNNYVFHYLNVEPIIKYANELHNYRDGSSMSLSKIYACFYNMISFLTNNISNKPNNDKDTLLINDIVQYIKINIKNDISVNNICRTFGYGRTALFDKFKKHIGVSLQGFIIGHRINLAMHLLINTDLSFENIADNCGYINAASLNKIFVRRQKKSLSSYRKEHKV